MDRVARLIARMSLPGGPSREELARAAWPAAVGKIIARHSRVTGLAGDRLLVEVEDETWRRQLQALEPQIRRKLGEILGPQAVGGIQFRRRIARPGPARAEANTAAGDEAEGIPDPVLRRLYLRQRARSTA
jgi:hypothetical protein